MDNVVKATYLECELQDVLAIKPSGQAIYFLNYTLYCVKDALMIP